MPKEINLIYLIALFKSKVNEVDYLWGLLVTEVVSCLPQRFLLEVLYAPFIGNADVLGLKELRQNNIDKEPGT